MRISFDLDDTLICYGGDVPCEPRLPLWWRLIARDEPLRLGTRRLAEELCRRGHELWIYTTSGRGERAVRYWLRLHGVRVAGVVNEYRHAKCFGPHSWPSKRPHAFGIDLHVDDSGGVAMEGDRYGFNVVVVEPTDRHWVDRVLHAVAGYEQGLTKAQPRSGGRG